MGDEETQDFKCEKLSTTLTYTQDQAPKDLSTVLPLIVEKVNSELDGVVDVEVGWAKSHGQVGNHVIRCSVTRLVSALSASSHQHLSTLVVHHHPQVDHLGRQVLTQCFHVPFTILDTNECLVARQHFMAHKCSPPSRCVNTVGSYECVCVGDGTLLPLLLDKDENDDETWTNQKEEEEEEEFWQSLESHAASSSPWQVSLETSPSCPSRVSTRSCCPADAWSPEGMACRETFACPVDPCGSKHDCVAVATCTRAASPLHRPPYTCACPTGTLGSGKRCRAGIDVTPPRPTVKYDGVTPTEETVRNNFYCSCTPPIRDACAGFPKCEGKHEECRVSPDTNTPLCACKDGYVDNGDEYGCVDETPPELRLRNDEHADGTTVLRQGDVYREYAVDVVDDNAEEYVRSLKIAYSRPLPSHCLTAMGQFHVNYTVATPWTSPPYVRVTRTVVIEDTDECLLSAKELSAFQATCPALVPRCDVEAGAVCHNTIGSYTCQCPPYTGGDGFLPIPFLKKTERGGFVWMDDDFDEGDVVVPDGYRGGTGCMDNTKPTLELRGPNPKVFRVPKCGGLRGIMVTSSSSGGGGGGGSGDENGVGGAAQGAGAAAAGGDGGAGGAGSGADGRASRYGNDIATMIQLTLGAELCATHAHANPRWTECVRATDRTHWGTVDLSDQVQVGDLVPVGGGGLEWRVPYNVRDAAGNKATTVWRTVVVQEVDVTDMEESIRRQVLFDKDLAIQRAVDDALREQAGGGGSGGKQQDVAAAAAAAVPSRGAKKGVRPIKGAKTAASSSSSTTTTTTTTTTECPKCPECLACDGSGRNESGGGGGLTLQQCETLCEASSLHHAPETCVVPEEEEGVLWIVVSSPWQGWIWNVVVSNYVSTTLALWIMMGCTATCLLVLLRWFLWLVVWPSPRGGGGRAAAAAADDEAHEQDNEGPPFGSVRYFQSPEPAVPPMPLAPPSSGGGGGPPRSSSTLNSSPNLFSPPPAQGVGLFATTTTNVSGNPSLYGGGGGVQAITPTSERR